MNEIIKVSVIIPIYNVEEYLDQCLKSVLNQTYQNLEVLLIDDGSTDNSGKLCNEYAAEDCRVRVIHQRNQGAAVAKNTGLELATGQYVTFLDSDDYVEQDWIHNMLTILLERGVEIVECNFDCIYINHSEAGNKESFVCQLFTIEEYIDQYLDNWTNSLFWNKLFSRTLLEQVRFRKERRCIDDEFFTYKAVTGAKSIYRTNKVLYHYRQRQKSAVRNPNNQLQITDDALEVLLERYLWIKRYFPNKAKKYLKHDIDIMFYFGSDFTFNQKLAEKFAFISKQYLKESIKTRAGFRTIYKAFRLKKYNTVYLLENTVVHQVENKGDLYP